MGPAGEFTRSWLSCDVVLWFFTLFRDLAGLFLKQK